MGKIAEFMQKQVRSVPVFNCRQRGVWGAGFVRCGVPRLEQARVSGSRNYDTKWLGYLCRKGDFLFRGIVIDRAEEASCERRLGIQMFAKNKKSIVLPAFYCLNVFPKLG